MGCPAGRAGSGQPADSWICHARLPVQFGQQLSDDAVKPRELQWTEGAISVNVPLNDNLRVGMQIHMYQMGQVGGPNIQVD